MTRGPRVSDEPSVPSIADVERQYSLPVSAVSEITCWYVTERQRRRWQRHTDDRIPGEADTVALEDQPTRAEWMRDPFRAGVERNDLLVRAWIGIDGRVAREFNERLTVESARRLGADFAALLSGLTD